MTRLIDADDALGRYYAEWEKQDIYDGAEDRDWLKKCIDEVPTIDAEPVRHGKWIVTAGGKQCDCPVCGERFDNTCNYDIRKTWKCCPVCCTRLEVRKDVNYE